MKVYSRKIGQTRVTARLGMKRRADMRTWFSISPVITDPGDKVCGVGVFGPRRGVTVDLVRTRS